MKSSLKFSPEIMSSLKCPYCGIFKLQIFATPETHIGFHPDAGASFYLSHLPGYIGKSLNVGLFNGWHVRISAKTSECFILYIFCMSTFMCTHFLTCPHVWSHCTIITCIVILCLVVCATSCTPYYLFPRVHIKTQRACFFVAFFLQGSTWL